MAHGRAGRRRGGLPVASARIIQRHPCATTAARVDGEHGNSQRPLFSSTARDDERKHKTLEQHTQGQYPPENGAPEGAPGAALEGRRVSWRWVG